MSAFRTERLFDDYNRYIRLQYIMGALHPQLAFENKWDVRYPSLLPVPTACLRVKATHNLTTGTTGQLYLNYVPGTLIASNATQGWASGITANTTCNGAGTVGVNYFVEQPFFPVPQMWDRYRLVGAEIKVTYTGNIFDRRGMIYGGVHYEPSTIAYKGLTGGGSIPAVANANVDRFSGNLGLIQNQLWPEVKTLSEGETHMSYVWTPDSPCNLLYPGALPSTSTSMCVLNSTVGVFFSNNVSANTHTNQGTSSISGPDRNINFYLQGLPASQQVIRVDIYELYEYIPDVAALNIVSTSSVRMKSEDVNSFADHPPSLFKDIQLKDASELLYKPDLYKEPSFLKKMGGYVTKIGGNLLDEGVKALVASYF